jgi:glutamate--cysteine ligase
MDQKKPLLAKLQVLNTEAGLQCLRLIRRGLEKECLRIDKEGNLAKTRHPVSLGSSLMHPFITTDYSEAMLELITPPVTKSSNLFKTLKELHQYTYQVLEAEEILWPGSMPCRLPPEQDIPIAEYGSSNLGKLKHIYRRGLGHRYGRAMQTISGVHYNFSFPDLFWPLYKTHLSQPASPDFVSEQYLGLIRNVLRLSWILPFLFGASPALAKGFLKETTAELVSYDKETLYAPYATSLRLSDLGYSNKAQDAVYVSYNGFSDFMSTLQKMIHTPYEDYRKIGVLVGGEYHQLSDAILQIEAEHYALIRPKRIPEKEERMFAAMAAKGIEYVEVRVLDLNPFNPLGVEPKAIHFLDAFLLTCFIYESPPLSPVEMSRIQNNHSLVVKRGREPGLRLLQEKGEPILLQQWALDIIEMMQPAMTLLEKATGNEYKNVGVWARNTVLDPETLLSARVLQELNHYQDGYFGFGKRWAKIHQSYYKTQPLAKKRAEAYRILAEDSFLAEKRIQSNEVLSFDEYLKRYLSI